MDTEAARRYVLCIPLVSSPRAFRDLREAFHVVYILGQYEHGFWIATPRGRVLVPEGTLEPPEWLRPPCMPRMSVNRRPFLS